MPGVVQFQDNPYGTGSSISPYLSFAISDKSLSYWNETLDQYFVVNLAKQSIQKDRTIISNSVSFLISPLFWRLDNIPRENETRLSNITDGAAEIYHSDKTVYYYKDYQITGVNEITASSWFWIGSFLSQNLANPNNPPFNDDKPHLVGQISELICKNAFKYPEGTNPGRYYDHTFPTSDSDRCFNQTKTSQACDNAQVYYPPMSIALNGIYQPNGWYCVDPNITNITHVNGITECNFDNGVMKKCSNSVIDAQASDGYFHCDALDETLTRMSIYIFYIFTVSIEILVRIYI